MSKKKLTPNAALAKLHDAYGKHAPTHLVGIATNTHLACKQYACSCGYVFWDSDADDTIVPPYNTPNDQWVQAVRKVYRGTGLTKIMEAYWYRHFNRLPDANLPAFAPENQADLG